MKKESHKTTAALWRIAVVWQTDWMQAQETFHALCRKADRDGHLTIRHFDAATDDFQRDVLRPLKAWHPHGVVARVLDRERLKLLRRRFPEIPFVAPVVAPPDMVDSCVVADIKEVFTLARDHFYSRGVRRVALYCAAAKHAAPGRVAAFRAAVPDGFEKVYAEEGKLAFTDASREWLRTLPKPVGIITPEAGMADYVTSWCQDFGLLVPQDVQVIGVDDAAECLASEPHLTSVALPSVRIGEVTLETMLRHLRGESPPATIPVAGGAIIARGSTGLQRVGRTALTGALRLMKTQARRGISAAQVARQSGVGLTTFYRQFGSTTGCTPARHLRRLRMEEACRMLRESSASLTDISAACGFSSLFAFSRTFRHETGQTPTAYRRKMADRRLTKK